MRTIKKQGKYRLVYAENGTYKVQVRRWFKWHDETFSISSTMKKKVNHHYGNALIYYKQCLKAKDW